MTDHSGDRKSGTLVLSNFLEAISGSKTQIQRVLENLAVFKIVAKIAFFQKKWQTRMGIEKVWHWFWVIFWTSFSAQKRRSKGHFGSKSQTQNCAHFAIFFKNLADPKGVFKNGRRSKGDVRNADPKGVSKSFRSKRRSKGGFQIYFIFPPKIAQICVQKLEPEIPDC